MNLIVLSPPDESATPTLDKVGGKALSLFQSALRGHAVPPAAVLTTTFFQPWMESIRATPEWKRFATATGEARGAEAVAVKNSCTSLAFLDEQMKQLATLREFLRGEDIGLAAVRSSSPEEDLDDTSFAGIYESVMGASSDELEGAIRTCFASALDPRAVAYKEQRGFDPLNPRIAVIIQKQVAADVAGVAFSLNPMNNCYDQCVINANFGLGETVVDGAVTPDRWVVDKVNKTILDTSSGTKNVAVYLNDDGGTVTRSPDSPSKLCLSEEQVLEVSALVARVEAEYGKPMDIEWAYDDKRLCLLQARPITTYYRLPKEMVTKPGEQKHLYQDGLLTEQGLTANMSTLGLDMMMLQSLDFMPGARLDDFMTFEHGMAFQCVGRMHANIGRMVKVVGKKNAIKPFRLVDELGARILESMDLSEYVPRKLPRGFVMNLIKSGLGATAYILPLIRANRKPDAFLKDTLEANDRARAELKAIFEREPSFNDAFAKSNEQTSGLMNRWLLPALIVAERARSKLKKLFAKYPESVQANVRNLEKSFPHNVTVEMGLALHDIAQLPEVRQTATPEACLAKLNDGQFSPEFMEKWHAFMENYGFRGPREIDVATARYHENPLEVFALLKTMENQTHPELTPRGVFDRGAEKRLESVRFLEEYLSENRKGKLTTFRKLYKRLENFAALRESPKYYWILGVDYQRRRVLTLAEQWVRDGRLDSSDQVFYLTVEDLVRAESGADLDIRTIAKNNREYYTQFNPHNDPPVLIDSRGYIPTLPPGPRKENELVGTPVSSGTVEGPVNLLSRPDEKPILPGDILVTKATDPGWTTLFINAAGVLLESGGALQHGASVAREMGKPCIVGIENVTRILRDGQTVRFDGAVGVVEILE